MVDLLFADADEDRDVRAEVGGFEASPADAADAAMAEAEDPALMPSMASLAAVVARSPTSDRSENRFFFFLFLGETTFSSSILFFHSEIFAPEKSQMSKWANGGGIMRRLIRTEGGGGKKLRQWCGAPLARTEGANESLVFTLALGRAATLVTSGPA